MNLKRIILALVVTKPSGQMLKPKLMLARARAGLTRILLPVFAALGLAARAFARAWESGEV